MGKTKMYWSNILEGNNSNQTPAWDPLCYLFWWRTCLPRWQKKSKLWQCDKAFDHINRLGFNCCSFSFQDSFSPASWQTIKTLCKWCFKGQMWGTQELMEGKKIKPTNSFVHQWGREKHSSADPYRYHTSLYREILFLSFIILVLQKTNAYGIRFLPISFSPQATCCWVVVFEFEPNSAKYFVA